MSDDKTNIARRFSVLSTLGEGGMGAVYLAHDQVLNRQVAVKMLRMKEATDEAYMRFQKEAKAIARLSHGAIMTALDFGVTDEGEPYLVLDYLEGTTLGDVLNERTRLEIDEAITLAMRVCEGLEYAHGQGVVHRDIKPSNIYLVNGEITADAIRILDFGLARFTVDDQRSTAIGTVIGSPTFMSPEQARGEAADERSDVYSLGCILFQMLTGEKPIAGDTALETLKMKLTEEPPSLKEAGGSLEFPPELERIVARSLAREIDGRYRNISSLLADLSEFERKRIEDYSTPVQELDTANGGSKTGTLNVGIVLVIAGVIAVSVAATALYLWQQADNAESVRLKENKKLSKEPQVKLSDPSTILAEDLSEIHPDFLEVRKYECVFKGLPKSEDLARLASTMNGKGITTCVFDAVDGQLDGKELRPLEDTAITNLRISQAILTAPALTIINRLPHLRVLILEGCEFESVLLKDPKNFKNLKNLTINSSTLRPDDLRNMPLLELLVNVDLSKCRGVTPEFLESLKRLKRLETFSLGGKSIGLAHLNSLNSLRGVYKLEMHDLDGVTMADAFKTIKGMPSLTSLDFEDIEMNSHDIDELCKLKKMKGLRFANVRGLKHDDWLAIAKMPTLEYVNLCDIEFDNHEDILAFVYSKNLKSLTSTGMQEIDAGIYTQLRRKIPEVIVDK